MTLLERVERAGNATAEGGRESERDALVRFRSQVAELISADEIAVLARRNMEQARSEVRHACRKVARRPEWAGVSAQGKERLEERVLDAVFGYGLIDGLLADPGITEVMVNGTQSIYIERDGRLVRTGLRYESESDLRVLVDKILGPLGRRVDEASPMVDARLPQGYRVNAVIPPISLCGTAITVRKFSERVMTLDDLQARGSVDGELRAFLEWAVRARRSIAVSGGTSSGKTTLLNALSCAIPPEERIVTIEDSAELRFGEHPHVVGLEARPRNAEGAGQVTIRDLVANALRMRPDRIIVGECRGAEALDMLQAMSTGHEGSLTTLHANSPRDSIGRLATMVRYGVDLPLDVIERNIASAIDLVVQMQRTPDGHRIVTEVVELAFDEADRRCAVRKVYRREAGEKAGSWAYAPQWVEGLVHAGVAGGREVEAWMQRCSSKE